MSQAFKLAVAQSTLRRSLKSKDSKDKEKRKSKSPWEVLKRKDKPPEKAPSPTPKRGKSVSPTPPSRDSKENKSKNRVSSYLNPPPPIAPGFSPVADRRIASSGTNKLIRYIDICTCTAHDVPQIKFVCNIHVHC